MASRKETFDRESQEPCTVKATKKTVSANDSGSISSNFDQVASTIETESNVLSSPGRSMNADLFSQPQPTNRERYARESKNPHFYRNRRAKVVPVQASASLPSVLDRKRAIDFDTKPKTSTKVDDSICHDSEMDAEPVDTESNVPSSPGNDMSADSFSQAQPTNRERYERESQDPNFYRNRRAKVVPAQTSTSLPIVLDHTRAIDLDETLESSFDDDDEVPLCYEARVNEAAGADQGGEDASLPQTNVVKGILVLKRVNSKNCNVQFSNKVDSILIERREIEEDGVPAKRHKPEVDESTDLPEMFTSNSDVDECGRLLVEKTQHTLESDEEEEQPETSKYDVSQLKGMEKRTIKYDGDIKITPFNMEEELEEGTVDNQGSFVFDREKKEEDDAWEKTIDWEKLDREHKGEKAGSDDDDDSIAEDDNNVVIDYVAGYNALEITLNKLKPKQTVNQYLAELQSKRPTPAEERKLRFQAKREKVEYVDPNITKAIEMTEGAQPFIDAGLGDFDTPRERLSAMFDENKR